MMKIYLFVALVFLYPISVTSFCQTNQNGVFDLETCVKIALDNNLGLKRSQVNLLTEEANLMGNRGQKIPSLSVGASTGYSWGLVINPVTNIAESSFRLGNVNPFASTNLLLYGGNQLNNRIQQSEKTIESLQLNLEATKNNITLNVINLYINVIFTKERLKIAENQLKSTQEQLSNTTKLVDAGSLPLANKLDIQAQNATNELEVINASNNLRIAKLNLSQAMQIPLDNSFDVETPDFEDFEYRIADIEANEIFEVAREIMPEITAAKLAVESSELGVKAAGGGYLPSLRLNGNVTSNYINPEPNDINFGTQISNNVRYGANLQLNIPILSNLTNRANVQRARLQKRLSEIQEIEAQNQLRQDIETAYTNAYAAVQSYRASIIRVESLGEAFRIAQQRFDAGAINFADFQLAQNNYFNAQADLVAAKYTYIFRAKVLDFYLGNPLEL